MKKIFLLILTALAFASCTLYMDEPEDEKKGKDDNIENGDGFSAPRTDVTADGTTTYQFNPTTKVFDETNSQYVLNVEDSVVWLSTSTPYEMIPQVGDAIYSTFSETFPNAMMGKVVSVTKENGMIKCECVSTTLGHVYKKLDVHYEIPIGAYTKPSIAEMSLAEKVKYAKQRTRKEVEFEVEEHELNIDFGGSHTFKEKKWASGTISGSLSLDYKEKKYRKVKFDFSLLDRSFYFVYTDSTITDYDWSLDCTVEAKATLLAFNEDVKKCNAMCVIPINLDLPISGTPFVVHLDPTVEASFSGTAAANFSKHDLSVKRYGVEKEKGKTLPNIISYKYDTSRTTFDNISADFTAKIGMGLTASVSVGPLADYANINASFTFGPQISLNAGLDYVGDEVYLITKPLTLDFNLGLDVAFGIDIQWDEKTPIWSFHRNIVKATFPIHTWYLTSHLTSFNIIPLERNQSGEYKEKYRAEAYISKSEFEEIKNLTIGVMIFNNNKKEVMYVPLKKVKDFYNGLLMFKTDFEIETKEDETYYGVIKYSDGEKIYQFADEMPFGVKIYMSLDKCRQAEGTYNPKARKHYNFEARGSLKTVGSSKVSQWGLRFRLYDKYGKPVSESQCTYFDPTDGAKSWGLKISSKKKGPYVLKIEPIYKTGYGTSTKVNVVEDKIVELPLDPDFGECKEKDWEKPDVYVNLTDKK